MGQVSPSQIIFIDDIKQSCTGVKPTERIPSFPRLAGFPSSVVVVVYVQGLGARYFLGLRISGWVIVETFTAEDYEVK